MNILIEVLTEVVVTLVVTLIGVGGAWLAAKLAKKQQLSNIAAATEQVVSAAQITVRELQQTLVDRYKSAGGGKLTPDQVAELNAALLEKTYEKLGNPALNLLYSARVDLDALIRGAGEAWIARIKESNL